MHNIHLPWTAQGSRRQGLGAFRADPASHTAHCFGTWGSHFHWPGSSKALGRLSPESQLTDSHPCTSLEHASPPSACFSKSASPNIRRGQEESASLPRVESSWQAAPRGGCHLTVVAQLQDPACAAQPFPSAGRRCAHCSSRQPHAFPCCIPGERLAGEGRGKITEVQVSVLKELAQHSTPLLHGHAWAGRWRSLGRAHSLGSPHYLR